MNDPKIAIFHNFMDNIGGAELVDLILARELKADIYTTNIDQEKIRRMGFPTDNIFSIGRVPVNPPWKQEAAYWRFKRLNLGNKYDFYLIAGDWAVSASKHNRPNAWYVYSPMREIFDLYAFTREQTVPAWKRPFFDLWVKYRRKMIKRDSAGIKRIVSISEVVRRRVQKYLDRESSVIYPPTETTRFRYRKNGDFWLSVNRLINHKRLDLQLEAFRRLPQEKLLIVGSYEKSSHFRFYAKHIIDNKPDNVRIVSWISSQELADLYADCKGLITTSKDEDYGMNAVEAMAAGKPVIAPDEGGYAETIIDGVTGKLIKDISVDKIVEAISEIGADPERFMSACRNRAELFDTSIFLAKIKALINDQRDRSNASDGIAADDVPIIAAK